MSVGAARVRRCPVLAIVLLLAAPLLVLLVVFCAYVYAEFMGWGGWQPDASSASAERAHRIDAQLRTGMPRAAVTAIFQKDSAAHQRDRWENVRHAYSGDGRTGWPTKRTSTSSNLVRTFGTRSTRSGPFAHASTSVDSSSAIPSIWTIAVNRSGPNGLLCSRRVRDRPVKTVPDRDLPDTRALQGAQPDRRGRASRATRSARSVPTAALRPNDPRQRHASAEHEKKPA